MTMVNHFYYMKDFKSSQWLIMYLSQLAQLAHLYFANSNNTLNRGVNFLKFSRSDCLNLCRLCHLSQKQVDDSIRKRRDPLLS
jgi:hypothetical protein